MKDLAPRDTVARAIDLEMKKTGAVLGGEQRAAGEHLIFSIMLNRYAPPDARHSARAEIDRMAVMLVEFAGRSDQ